MDMFHLGLFFVLQIICCIGSRNAPKFKETKQYRHISTAADLVLNRGSSALMNENHVKIMSNDSLLCRFEVIPDQICLRIGQISSRDFSCNLTEEKISYMHNGSPLFTQDCIKLKLFLFFRDKTVKQIMKIKVKIKDRPVEERLFIPAIEVNDLGGIATIDREILPTIARKNIKKCEIFFSNLSVQWPANGRLVLAQTSASFPCSSFSVIYKHHASNIPDKDFVPFEIRVSTGDKTGVLRVLRYHIMIKILAAGANSPPFLYSRLPRIIVQQYSIKQISKSNIHAVSFETNPAHLLLSISSPSLRNLAGFFASTDDPDMPLEGINQEQINQNKIIFIAPKGINKSRRPLLQYMYVRATSPYGETSKRRLRLIFFVRKFIPHYLSIIQNTPIHVLEGQAYYISTMDIDITCKDSRCQNARFSVWRGPQHGKLLQNSNEVTRFTKRDILNKELLYKHDGSETLLDNVVLTVTDRHQIAYLTLSVKIEPLDDSPPFLTVNKFIVAEKGVRTRIEKRVLSANDPDTKKERIMFNIVKQPNKGKILRGESNGTFQAVKSFKEIELEMGMIYYETYFDGPSTDKFTFVLSDGGNDPNLSEMLEARITIPAVDRTPPFRDGDGECSIKVNETEKMISLDFIRYVDDTSSTSEIFFRFLQENITDSSSNESTILPENIILMEKLRTLDVIFNQKQIHHKKVFVINKFNEVGLHRKIMYLRFVVFDKQNNTTPLQTCRIIIEPVDNLPPTIIFQEPFRVSEGGKGCFDSDSISLKDKDTEISALSLRVASFPTEGEVLFNGRHLYTPIWIPIGELTNQCLWYNHSGSESIRDHFDIIASDGKQSERRTLFIEIMPVNDHRPVFIKNKATIEVMESSSTVLDSGIFKVTDADSNMRGITFYVIERPKFGLISLENSKTRQFNQNHIDHGLLVYSHNETEIGPFMKRDSFKINVCDLVPVASDCTSVLTIDVNIIPINSCPPSLEVKRPLRVYEGDKTSLNMNHLTCNDIDTVPSSISIQIIGFPNFGFLENIAPSQGSEQSNVGIPISEFKCSDLLNELIHYVQSNHSGIEPTADRVMLFAFDGKFRSNVVEMSVVIEPVSDEPPKINITKIIKINEGGWKLIDSEFLKITDKDVPKDKLLYSLQTLPTHGRLFSRCNNGNLGLQTLGIGRKLEYNSCVIIYGHDDSESRFDQFDIAVSDKLFTIKQSVEIEILPVNDKRPKIVRNVTMPIHFGKTKNISRNYLEIRDLDTRDSDLKYTITALPVYGSLRKELSSIYGGKNEIFLKVNSTFKQSDINRNKISYSSHLMPLKHNRDHFIFNVTDGVHSIQNLVFNFRVRLSCRKYLTIISKDVIAESPKILVTTRNLQIVSKKKALALDMDKIRYQLTKPPSYGNLQLVGAPEGGKIASFSHRDLQRKALIYIPTKYPMTYNDTFKFIVTYQKCLQRGKLNILLPKKETVKLLERNSPLNIIKTGQTTITPLELRGTEDHKPRNLVYRVVKPPKHGVIVMDRKSGLEFTQQNINELRISYELINTTGRQDQAQMQIYVLNSQGQNLSATKIEDFIFNININVKQQKQSKVITNELITSLEYISPNVIGKIISNRELLTYNCSSVFDPALTYLVIEPPIHGELVHNDTGLPITRFTQDDINKGRVLYKLTDKHESFGDKVFLDVLSNKCSRFEGIEFGITWSIVTLSDSITVECSAGKTSIKVKLLRKGYDKQGSVVEVHLKSLVEDEKSDFENAKIRFYSEVKDRVWVLPEEAMEYELLEVELMNGVNTLLGKQRRITINVLKAQDLCSQQPKSQKALSHYVIKNNGTVKTKGILLHSVTPVKESTRNYKLQAKKKEAQIEIPSDRKSSICEKGWSAFGADCYILIQRPSSWRKAVKFCQKKKSSLFNPITRGEENFVKEMLEGRSIWIGIKRNRRGKWKLIIKGPNQGKVRKMLTMMFRSSTNTSICVYINKQGNWQTADCKKKGYLFICKRSKILEES